METWDIFLRFTHPKPYIPNLEIFGDTEYVMNV